MRPIASAASGAASPRVVLLLALALLAAGLTIVLLRPPQPGPVSTPPAAPLELPRTNLVLEAGHLRVAGGTNIFTGFMLEHYAGGQPRSRSAVSNGLLHGLSQGWFTNGQLQVSEVFRQGVSHGTRTKWYASGVKQSEAAIVDGKLHGTFRRWHENGALSEQVEFIADRPEGESLSYYPSGFLKARVVMKDGQPAEQKFYKDGELKP